MAKTKEYMRAYRARKRADAQSQQSGQSALRNAKTAAEIAEYLRKKHGVKVGASFEYLDLERARNVAYGVDELVDEFGKPEAFSKLTARAIPKGVLGTTLVEHDQYGMLSAIITMSTGSTDYGNDSMNGAKGTVAHEFGHVIVADLINRRYGDPYERVRAWNRNTVSTEIMQEAVRNVKKTEYGSGKSSQELRRGISRYAGHYKGGKGNDEALAEAVCDYIVNKGNANPLSAETVKILKRELAK